MIVDYFRFRIPTSKKFVSENLPGVHEAVRTLLLLSLLTYGGCRISSPGPELGGEEPGDIVRISFLEVGQGDATLLSCPDKEHFTLIDAGEANSRYPGAEFLFARALQQRVPEKSTIELAINTHPHQDHLYGYFELLKKHQRGQLKIFRYLDNGGNDPSSLLEEKIRGSLDFLKIRYLNGATKSYWRFAPCPSVSDLYIDVLYPEARLAQALDCPNNLNDCSLVIAIRRGTFTLAIMGDTTLRWEQAVLKDKLSPEAFHLIKNVDVLRLGHHGSVSTSEALLRHSNPKAVVLSTGAPQKGTTSLYRFPESEVIERIRQYGERERWPEGEKIAACFLDQGRAAWEERGAPANLWSTARDGSIELLLSSSGYHLRGTR